MRFLKRGFDSILGTWVAGLLALLPLILTVSLLAWVVNLLHTHLGPESLVGRFFALFGQPFTKHPALEYVIGFLVLAAVIYPLGLVAQSSLQKPLLAFAERVIRKVPLVGKLYALADRFVGLLDQKQDADLAAMSPVWCLFGGEGIAVLALLPNPDSVPIDGRDYVAILVPTAPVPIGGGLLYVPKEWIRPANIGVEKLTSIYVSMGIVLPPGAPAGQKPRIIGIP